MHYSDANGRSPWNDALGGREQPRPKPDNGLPQHLAQGGPANRMLSGYKLPTIDGLPTVALPEATVTSSESKRLADLDNGGLFSREYNSNNNPYLPAGLPIQIDPQIVGGEVSGGMARRLVAGTGKVGFALSQEGLDIYRVNDVSYTTEIGSSLPNHDLSRGLSVSLFASFRNSADAPANSLAPFLGYSNYVSYGAGRYGGGISTGTSGMGSLDFSPAGYTTISGSLNILPSKGVTIGQNYTYPIKHYSNPITTFFNHVYGK